MRLTTVQPRAEIAPWIHHFWVFESGIGLPAEDARIVVPNGRPKLIVPWRNALIAKGAGATQTSPEGEIVVIGIWDQPSILSSPTAETVTIGVEFRPNGLARFFDMDLDALYQRIVPLEEGLGAEGFRLAKRIDSADSIEEAVELVQLFLLSRLRIASERGRSEVDEAFRMMVRSGFTAEITAIADHLGCSRRHLQDLFRRRVGLTPKRVQSILAFESVYRKFSQNKDERLLRDEALDVWFDQAHFIRTFRQFTGHSPGRFAELENEFGRIFYRA